jgi:uncharacterized protein (TIGR03435 family)
MNWESQLMVLLTASIVRPFALVATAWFSLRVCGIRHPASKHAVWTAVLVGMLPLPFVSVITPHWKVPVLPAKREIPAQGIVARGADVTAPMPVDFAASKPEAPSVETVVIWIYLAGLFAMVVYRAAGWVLLWRIMLRARLLRGRFLRESDDVLTPVAVGILRPAVILPVGWRQWDADTRRAVLAHELAHLRRHDAVVSALAWWTRCLFWFHPLAWWVSRQVSELAELACDAAALEKGGDPARYSRMLLAFADSVNRAGRRVALPGMAMAGGSGVDRRIDSVFEFSDGPMRKLARPTVALALIGVPLICLVASVGLGKAQPAEARFEAASVKPTTSQHGMVMRGGPGTSDPTRISWSHVYVPVIVEMAYHVNGYQIVNSSWLDSQPYDIEATLPPGASRDQFREMLINLLAERFHLVLHRESKDVDGFQLVAGKNGPKLRESPPTDPGEPAPYDSTVAPKTDERGFPIVERSGVAVAMKVVPGTSVPSVFLTARAVPMSELARMIGDQLRHPVVDKTGLTGKYDYTLEFPAMESLDVQGDGGPSIVTSVQEQLGLKLEPKKVPLKMFIIDHADKTPTSN